MFVRTLQRVIEESIRTGSGKVQADLTKEFMEHLGAAEVTPNIIEYSPADITVFTEGLFKHNPKAIAKALGQDVPMSKVEEVLRVDHKPSAVYANKVAMRREKLTPFLYDYVISNGKKVAYDTLLERQSDYMSVDEIVDIMEVTYREFGVVRTPRLVNMTGVSSSYRPGTRRILSKALELANDATDNGDPQKTRKMYRNGVCWEAIRGRAAGLPIPDGYYHEDNPTAARLKRLDQSIKDASTEGLTSNINQELMNGGAADKSFVLMNPEYVEAFKNAPAEVQRDMFHETPSWKLANYAKDLDVLLRSEQQGRRNRPSASERHYPTYETVEQLRPEDLYYKQVRRVFMRLVVNRFGDNRGKWETLRALYDESWDGTIGELLDTAEAV